MEVIASDTPFEAELDVRRLVIDRSSALAGRADSAVWSISRVVCHALGAGVA
jgi:hypothetical protein